MRIEHGLFGGDQLTPQRGEHRREVGPAGTYADVVSSALPLALFVPDGDFRAIDGAPFGPALDAEGTDDVDRILRHLGRHPNWSSTSAPIR